MQSNSLWVHTSHFWQHKNFPNFINFITKDFLKIMSHWCFNWNFSHYWCGWVSLQNFIGYISTSMNVLPTFFFIFYQVIFFTVICRHTLYNLKINFLYYTSNNLPQSTTCLFKWHLSLMCHLKRLFIPPIFKNSLLFAILFTYI